MPEPCIFILKYPNETSPTATFQPSMGALLANSKMKFKSNAAVHEMYDPRVIYTYIKGGAFRERTYDFLLTESEVNLLYTFWVAALGKSFKLLDPFTDPAYILQRFSPDSTEPELALAEVGIWHATLTFRDALT